MRKILKGIYCTILLTFLPLGMVGASMFGNALDNGTDLNLLISLILCLLSGIGFAVVLLNAWILEEE